MIALVEGRIAERRDDRVIVVAGGVGYEVLVSSGTLQSIPAGDGTVRLFTRMQVRDDAMVLFGFASLDEREVFDLLVSVSGVGPKFALAALSTLSPDELRRAVLAGDVDALTAVPGIGKKVAGRIMVDLRDKLGDSATIAILPTGAMGEVREALLSLGLSPDEAREAMGGLAGEASDERPVEDLLREALQAVGRS